MTTVASILESKVDPVVHTIAPEASVFEAVRLMADKNIGDLVKDIISEQQFIIEQLEHYISGQRD